jgi:hypothetical protein
MVVWYQMKWIKKTAPLYKKRKRKRLQSYAVSDTKGNSDKRHIKKRTYKNGIILAMVKYK